MARRIYKKTAMERVETREALELISRLLVGSSYRVPVEGRGSKPLLQSTDIAGAVGYMRHPLERRATTAVAARAGEIEIARLGMQAYRAVLRAVRHLRPPPLDLHQPADRWRLRLVLHDAATELVWPERRRPYAELAKAAKMRKDAYRRTHHCATAVLEEALNNGSRDFQRRLFAYEVHDDE